MAMYFLQLYPKVFSRDFVGEGNRKVCASMDLTAFTSRPIPGHFFLLKCKQVVFAYIGLSPYSTAYCHSSKRIFMSWTTSKQKVFEGINLV